MLSGPPGFEPEAVSVRLEALNKQGTEGHNCKTKSPMVFPIALQRLYRLEETFLVSSLEERDQFIPVR